MFYISAVITGCIILAGGGYMFSKGRNTTRLLKKYEQENRSSDGTVQFDDIASSRTHVANTNLARVITVMGFFTALFGLSLLGYGLGLFSYP